MFLYVLHIFANVVQIYIYIYIYILPYISHIFSYVYPTYFPQISTITLRRPCRHRRQSPDIAGRIGALAGPHPGQWVNITCV